MAIGSAMGLRLREGVPCARKVWVTRKRTFQELHGILEVVLRWLCTKRHRLEIEVISGQVPSRCFALRGSHHEIARCRIDDRNGDLILNPGKVLAAALIPLGPDVMACSAVDELRRYPDAFPGDADATFQNGFDVEVPRDLPYIHILALECKC